MSGLFEVARTSVAGEAEASDAIQPNNKGAIAAPLSFLVMAGHRADAAVARVLLRKDGAKT